MQIGFVVSARFFRNTESIGGGKEMHTTKALDGYRNRKTRLHNVRTRAAEPNFPTAGNQVSYPMNRSTSGSFTAV